MNGIPIYDAIYVERISMHQDCPNCNKVICEDCEIRILHEGVLDVICPNCDYSFGTSMIIDRNKENSK
jgi:hypothetical protein